MPTIPGLVRAMTVMSGREPDPCKELGDTRVQLPSGGEVGLALCLLAFAQLGKAAAIKRSGPVRLALKRCVVVLDRPIAVLECLVQVPVGLGPNSAPIVLGRGEQNIVPVITDPDIELMDGGGISTDILVESAQRHAQVRNRRGEPVHGIEIGFDAAGPACAVRRRTALKREDQLRARQVRPVVRGP